jgi:hypothetical protein
MAFVQMSCDPRETLNPDGSKIVRVFLFRLDTQNHNILCRKGKPRTNSSSLLIYLQIANLHRSAVCV